MKKVERKYQTDVELFLLEGQSLFLSHATHLTAEEFARAKNSHLPDNSEENFKPKFTRVETSKKKYFHLVPNLCMGKKDMKLGSQEEISSRAMVFSSSFLTC